MGKTLVIYYSRKGQNYVNGSIKNLPKGNTEIVAEVKTKKTYAEDYRKCTEEAKEEIKNQVFPELIEQLDSVADYDSIVVAGPCWWGTYPMAVFTQLKGLDFIGKKVFSLMTHEGSGIGGSPVALRKYCVGAEVGEGLAIHGAEAAESKATVEAWAKRNL